MNEHAEISFAIVLLAGIACQWVAWRVKLPAIIFLLLAGIVAGPVMGWLDPAALAGDLLFPFVSLSVAVILFEGSLTLKFSEINGLERVIRNLITFGAALTWLVTALATRFLMGFSWEVSFLFGAFMVVSGPTVIVPLLRTVRPKSSIGNILRWEGILIDPIGATLALLVYQFIVAEGVGGGFASGIALFGKILAIGFLLGGAVGYAFGFVLRRHWIPHYLQDFAALALVCAVFAVSNGFVEESGLLSVTVMGIWLANMKGVDLEDILNFKESLSVLLISTLFIALAARMELAGFVQLGWPAVAVFAILQLAARPLTAHLSAIGSRLTTRERHLLAWIAPRGIVAAAISALFSLRLESLGYADANQLAPLTFAMIVGTVLLQSLTAAPLARALKVSEPDAKGFLIIGANSVAQAIASALQENGFRVLLVGRNWDRVKEAKMRGLPTYWGNPVSEHADRHLNLIGLGRLLALTSNQELNALAARAYRQEFGAKNAFTIRSQSAENGPADRIIDFKRGGLYLFGKDVTLSLLEGQLAQGGELKTTLLTEKFGFDDYLRDGGPRRIPMFAIDSSDRIRVFTEGSSFKPQPGWRVIGLTLAANRN